MRKIIGALVFGAIIGASTIAAAGSTGAREVYAPADGTGPRIVIIGQGYASAEDSAELRLVDYDPMHNRIVYRVLEP